MPLQSVRAKQAETQRPYVGERLLRHDAFIADAKARATLARRDFAALAARDIQLSPFLEVGAGRTQRSLTLRKEHGAHGVATDISISPLRDAPYMQLILQAADLPLRICCDMHHLPFRDDTFRFVFAYRTLHHLGDPSAAIAEIHRVLGRGGHFLCNEEPVIGPLLRTLRGQRTLSQPPTALQRLAARYRLEKIFWDDGAPERSVGIIEARYSLSQWRDALAPFTHIEALVSRRLRLKTDLRTADWQYHVARFVGGNIKALCHKQEGTPVASENLFARLRCLDCHSGPLNAHQSTLHCMTCGRVYPRRDGVLLMFPSALQALLYPRDNT